MRGEGGGQRPFGNFLKSVLETLPVPYLCQDSRQDSRPTRGPQLFPPRQLLSRTWIKKKHLKVEKKKYNLLLHTKFGERFNYKPWLAVVRVPGCARVVSCVLVDEREETR